MLPTWLELTDFSLDKNVTLQNFTPITPEMKWRFWSELAIFTPFK